MTTGSEIHEGKGEGGKKMPRAQAPMSRPQFDSSAGQDMNCARGGSNIRADKEEGKRPIVRRMS